MPSAPTARVNDYAGLLSRDERARLESRLAERERATGTQMVVAIFPSLEGESLEDVSIRLAQQWRIGQKGLDNGVILLVFPKERQLRFEIGYGLEPVIPDSIAAKIIRDEIGPRFRERQYAAGLEAAVDAIFQRVGAGSPDAERTPPRPASPSSSAPLILFVVVLGVIALVLAQELFSARRFVRRNGYTTGRGGDWSRPVITPMPGWRRGGSGGGGFSGGGGRFGGGGASGGW